MQHLISLINDHVAQATQGQDMRTLNEVDETTRRGDQYVASLGKLTDLITNWTATVGDARAKHGTVAELASLVEDLDGQLASRDDDDNQRLSTNLGGVEVNHGRVGTRSSELLGLAHQLVQDGDEVSGSLAGTWLTRSVSKNREECEG